MKRAAINILTQIAGTDVLPIWWVHMEKLSDRVTGYANALLSLSIPNRFPKPGMSVDTTIA